ncbi:MAG: PAS domain-containing protein [Pirellulales bacterium]|nr:PAS domain-containing protein [Pirellulales bacterium]
MTRTVNPQQQRRFALDIVRRLRAAGFQALWAGGCVRDELLGRHPKDYDVATDARPEQIRQLFRRTVDVGAAFGVVVVVGPRHAGQIEVATFRRDSPYSDGRHPDHVTYSSAEEDARRRDFTINGLFYDPVEGRVIDYVGGQEDLHRRIVRAIGDPHERFLEDRLRMLRAVRFAACLDFALDTATRDAIIELAPRIVDVSAERISQEMRLILTSAQRVRACQELYAVSLLRAILPEAAARADAAARVEASTPVADPPRAGASAWQQTLDTAFGQIAEPVLVFDREGRLVLWNAAAEEMLSHCKVAPGDSVATLLTKAGLTAGQGRPLPPAECASARALRGERIDNFEEELPTPDGVVRHLLVSAAPLRSDGQIEGAVVVWRDVTHIRELERMRAEFLSAVGHQLRTPLTSVLGFAELLERKADTGIPDEELKKGLRTIAEQARRINALVTDLIDGSQAEAGHLRLEVRSLDLTDLIQSVLSRFRSAEPAYTFRAEMPAALPPVRADPKRIERVLRNLLSNAAKFSPAGTEIVLRAAADRTRVTVSIADRGFGIAREDIPAVFMPFYRTPQLRGQGVGLGLFMARAIVEAHGGAMWVQSQVGEGSTFYFSLPIAHPC